jgi:hypothetical protein
MEKFTWKSLHGIVPSNGVLANRHIPVSSHRPQCEIHREDDILSLRVIMHWKFGGS